MTWESQEQFPEEVFEDAAISWKNIILWTEYNAKASFIHDLNLLFVI
jgi:hypothetical protein